MGYRTGGAGTPAQAEFEELKEMVAFGPEHATVLAEALEDLRPHLREVAEAFYATILEAPHARSVLKSPAQVERLKGTLVRWIEDVLAGPHDADFHGRQRRIGQVHVIHGVPPRYVFATMSTLREELRSRLEAVRGSERALAFASAFDRLTCVGLATVMDTYIETREERELDTLQGLLVSNLPATVLLIDAEGLVTSAAASDTGLFEGETSVRRPYLDVLPRTLVHAARLEARVERALATGHEVTLPRVDVEEDGRVRSFRISVVPLDHPRARALVHLADLTDVIQAESRVRQSETLAQLGAFSAAVAHELRNPLAGISGALQVISRSLDEDDRRRSVMEKVDGQLRRLDRMVGELLDLARPTEPRLAQVELGDPVRGAVELVQREFPAARIEVEGAGEALADPDLLGQILLNLLQNAAQAQDGAGRVLVQIDPAQVRVSDDGPGVPPANRRRIFDPFFTTRVRGTGLGLAICRRAALSMGADLHLTDGPLAGASFVLRWPT
ncbi:MAG: protoglobin domain-containing protein [Gemmatimonadota bacterium]